MCTGGDGANLSDLQVVRAREVVDAVAEPYMAETAALPPEQVSVDILIVGDVDYTAAYSACQAESGYEVPVEPVDPAQELAWERQVADASNRWAACPRENGLVGLKDADPPKADDWRTTPTVVLPVSVSKDLLRAVVQVCPPFDLDARRRQEAVVEPKIGFDAPGWGGRSKLLSGVLDRETAILISELVDIIYEPLDQFFEESPPPE
jgi:hypothetical protein